MRVVTPICFEATDGRVCRRLVTAAEGDADLIINVTNDGWFGSSDAGRRHHALLGRWRAAELGVPVIRAANTGISGLIPAGGGPGGFVDMELGARTEGVLVADVVLGRERETLYRRTGNVVGVACALSLLIFLPVACWRGRAAAQGERPGDTMVKEASRKEPDGS